MLTRLGLFGPTDSHRSPASGLPPVSRRSMAQRCCVVVSSFVMASLISTPGCRRSDQENAPEGAVAVAPVSIQLNWYPESEHGGVYQAIAEKTYESADLDVTVHPGGANTPIAGELQLGRSQFAITNADDVVLFRRGGADIVAVAAVVQNSPRCILVRAESPAESLDQLAGMTLQRQAGRSFVEFMRGRGLLDGVQEVPYLGTVAPLVADPNVAIQAYLFSEPLQAEQAGVDVRALMVSDLGWNPYSSVLVTTGTLIQEQPELVQTVVDATLSGWRSYLQDPSAGNPLILQANSHGLTAQTLDYGVDKLRQLAMPDPMKIDEVGKMTDQRWQTLVDQMDALSPDEAGKAVASECYTLEFLN